MQAAKVHSMKPKVRPVFSLSIPAARGARAPPRKVAMPPMIQPQAMDMKMSLP